MALRGSRARSVAGASPRGRVAAPVAVTAIAVVALAALAAGARADALVGAPRPFVVADLSDRTDAGVALTFGRSVCDECTGPEIETTSLIAFAFGDIAVRPGLKLWLSLPFVRRHSTAGEFRPARSHTAFGQLTVGVRQMWNVERAWRPRLSVGASFSGTPRSGAGGEAGLTLDAAKVISGLHPSHFAVETTTTRLHGDAAVAKGPVLAQFGLALLVRAPDERQLRGELAFEALVGARLGERVAVLAELTASVLDRSIICPSGPCAQDHTGFTHQVSGNLGVRVSLGRVLLGARLVVPLTGDPSPYLGGTDVSRESPSPAFSFDAVARF